MTLPAVSLLAGPQQLDIEYQCRVRRNHATGAAAAVTQVWRDTQLTLPANFHAGYTFVPALDHLSSAECELEGLSTIDRAVKFLTAREPAGVVDLHLVTGFGDCSGAFLDVPVLQAVRGGVPLAFDLGWTA